MLGLYQALLPPIAAAYRPDLVLVSAGFDAHVDDPLGGLRMTDDGFAALCGLVRDVAVRHADGRLALMLEGGYDLGALSRGVRNCLEVLTGARTPPDIAAGPEADRVVERMREAHVECWPCLRA